MEIRPHLSLKNIYRTVLTAVIAVSLPACVKHPEMKINVSCSAKPAYGSVNMGSYPHAVVRIEGRNWDGTGWLHIGEGSSKPITIAYGNNRLEKTIDGFVRSIRAEGILVLRNGQYNLGIGLGSEDNNKPILQQIVTINCSQDKNSAKGFSLHS